MPKELHVPLVWLDGEVALGPAVLVCLSPCVRICVRESVFSPLVHLSDLPIVASVSILHMYSWSEIEFNHQGEKTYCTQSSKNTHIL